MPSTSSSEPSLNISAHPENDKSVRHAMIAVVIIAVIFFINFIACVRYFMDYYILFDFILQPAPFRGLNTARFVCNVYIIYPFEFLCKSTFSTGCFHAFLRDFGRFYARVLKICAIFDIFV